MNTVEAFRSIPCNKYDDPYRICNLHFFDDLEDVLNRLRKSGYKELAIFENCFSSTVALIKLNTVLDERINVSRETANDRWTSVFHTTYEDDGTVTGTLHIAKTLVIACRDKVDAMMFLMEWPR
jgi:hypothetical protein